MKQTQCLFVLLFTFLLISGCKKKDTFHEDAMKIIKEHQRQAELDNQKALSANHFSEGVQEIMEWFDYVTPVSSEYKPITIDTKQQYDQQLDNSPQDVKALFLDFRNDRELAKKIDLKRISEFKNLEYLETLGFDALPKEIYSLRKLRVLDTNSELDSIEAISNLKELEEIEALWTDNEFPPTIKNLTKLKSLRIIGSPQRHNSAIFDLPNLESLWIDFSDTVDMKGISKLTQLKCLITNKATKEIAQMTHLKGLSFQRNYNLDYPNEFSKLQSLVAFSIHGNSDIGKAPDFVSQLKNLEFIKFQGCDKLASVPDSYNQLSELKKFDLFYTAIREVPGNLSPISQKIEIRKHEK